jgi:hypothetical protein
VGVIAGRRYPGRAEVDNLSGGYEGLPIEVDS